MANRLDFQPDQSQLSPVDEPTAAPSAPVSGEAFGAAPQPETGNMFQRCSVPALTPVSADSLRQFIKPGIPQNRLSPLPILTPPAPVKSTSASNSTAKTTSTATPQSTGVFPVASPTGTSPAGQDKNIQVNSQGVFYGSNAFTWDKVFGAFGVTGTVSISGVTQIGAITDVQAAINSKVPQTTTVNSHALSSNVVISASDITTGTLPHAQLPPLISSDIPNNAANTSGTAANLSGTPALPNGTTATTQTQGNNSSNLATTAYVDTGLAAAAGSNSYRFTQSSPSSTWVIVHDLNSVPLNMTVMDSTDTQVLVEANFTSNNVVTLHFTAPESGTAFLAK